jgi:3-isopropylmalate/(R)-2-methylmalate dehydratase large subunit
MMAPDATTVDYLRGRPFAPRAEQWEAALADWASLPTDPGAVFDREVSVPAASIEPMVTWGTSPQDCAPITERVPYPDAFDAARRESLGRALAYMGLGPGTPLTEVTVDRETFTWTKSTSGTHCVSPKEAPTAILLQEHSTTQRWCAASTARGV